MAAPNTGLRAPASPVVLLVLSTWAWAQQGTLAYRPRIRIITSFRYMKRLRDGTRTQARVVPVEGPGRGLSGLFWARAKPGPACCPSDADTPALASRSAAEHAPEVANA